MAKTQKNQKKHKVDKRRVAFGVLAGVMALLILLPMLTMILGGAGAVTQSEIDALKQQQAESQALQQQLEEQMEGRGGPAERGRGQAGPAAGPAEHAI